MMGERAKAVWRRLASNPDATGSHRTAELPTGILRLSCLLLMFYGASDWTAGVPLKIACGAALFSDRLLSSGASWLCMTLLLAFSNGSSWHSIDNHKYLINYWSLCVATALIARARSRSVLAGNARLLIGLCFLFAVIWKIMAGEFADGSFLHHVLLTDSRVQVPTSIVGQVPLPALETNRSLLRMQAMFPDSGTEVSLSSSSVLRTIALVASWWTLLIEGLIARATCAILLHMR